MTGLSVAWTDLNAITSPSGVYKPTLIRFNAGSFAVMQ